MCSRKGILKWLWTALPGTSYRLSFSVYNMYALPYFILNLQFPQILWITNSGGKNKLILITFILPRTTLLKLPTNHWEYSLVLNNDNREEGNVVLGFLKPP